MNRVYLDHAATTDVLPAAIDAMVQQMRAGGNPSSLPDAMPVPPLNMPANVSPEL